MYSIKVIISFIAVLLTFIAYIPYLKDTINGKTKPHVYSWFIWGLIALITLALQISAKAGIGSVVTLAAGAISFTIFILGLKNGQKNITITDTIFFLIALFAVFIWLIVKQPVISIIIVTCIDMLGFIPTVRKSWHKPFSETLFSYQLNFLRHLLTVLALQQYNIITWLNPFTWALANGLFSLMIIYRRRINNK